MMRLDKYLCYLQLGTRSQVRDFIKKGTVTVNGTVVKKSDYKLDETADRVCCMGKELAYKKLYYYMLHKPAGVVTATSDNRDKTVMDLVSRAAGKDLFPAGRLDKDTEGLLLVTNDGELAHNLLSPKKHVAKTYYVECAGEITQDKLSRLETGLDIGDGTPTKPAKARLLSAQGDSYALELTITEGRFHQVKRMVGAVGGTVLYLKRLSMGSLVLDPALPKGQYRELTEPELDSLKNMQP